jgi:hypothetical protein
MVQGVVEEGRVRARGTRTMRKKVDRTGDVTWRDRIGRNGQPPHWINANGHAGGGGRMHPANEALIRDLTANFLIERLPLRAKTR